MPCMQLSCIVRMSFEIVSIFLKGFIPWPCEFARACYLDHILVEEMHRFILGQLGHTENDPGIILVMPLVSQ